MRSGVYKITCVPTGKFYVGSSRDVPRRWKYHRDRLGKGLHNNPHLQRSWKKYGADSFVFSVLEYAGLENLIVREQHYIDQAFAAGRTFNVRRVAERNAGCKHSPETRARISAALRGRRHSPETIARIAALNRGRKRSAGVRRRISEIKKALAATPRGLRHLDDIRKLRKFGPEFRRKISEAHRGRKVSDATKRKISAAHAGREFAASTRSRMSATRRQKLATDAAFRAENETRIRRGQSISVQRKLAATHCRNGHEYTSESTSITHGGRHRRCRTCHNAANAKSYRGARTT